MRSRLSQLPSTLWLLAACAVPLSTVYYVIATYVPIPFWDQWFEVRWYRAFLAGDVPLTNLWRLHNEHNIFFPRLTFLADLMFFQGRNISLLAWCLAIQAITCALFIREARRAALPHGVVAFLAGVYLALLFSFTQMENFISPFQVPFVLVVGAPLAAAVCLAEALDRTAAGRAPWRWLLPSMAAAFVATFSMANGVLVWPLLVLTAVVYRLPRSATAVLATVAVLSIARWYADRTGIGLAPSGPRDPMAMLVFLTMYLGAPFGTLSQDIAGIAGTIGVCLAVGLSLSLVRRARDLSRFERVCATMLWFTFGSAAATTLGRSDWGHTIALVSRYATTSLMFWASVISLLAAVVVRFARGRQLGQAVLMGTVALVFLGLLTPAHVRTGREGHDTARKKRLGTLAFVVGVDDAYLGSLFPDRAALLALRPFLRARRLAVFHAAWPHWLGQPLARVTDIAPPGPVRGVFASARVHSATFTTPGPEVGLRVRGWARGADADTGVLRIVLADDGGVVRGFASTAARPDAVNPLYGDGATERSAWFGYVRADGNRPVRAYALSPDGRTATVLEGAHFVGDLRVHPSPLAAADWDGGDAWDRRPRAQVGSVFLGGYAFGSRPVGTAVLESSPVERGGARYLIVPFTTGPDTRNLSLRLVHAETGETVATHDLRAPVATWADWTIPLDRDMPARVRVRVEDAGAGRGQWIAVGEPHLIPTVSAAGDTEPGA